MGWLIPLPFRVAALLVPLAGFAATLPTRAPFAPGQGLGRGLLLGALGAWMGAWTLARSVDGADSDQAQRPSSAAFVAPFALAVALVCVPLLLMRDVVTDALMGLAMGWLTTALVLLAGVNARGLTGRALALSLTSSAAWTVTLCGWAALGEMGGSVAWGANMTAVPWSAVALPLAASVPLLLMLCALTRRGMNLQFFTNLFPSTASRETALSVTTNGIRWLTVGLLLLFAGAQFAHKIGAHPNLFRLLGMGLLAGGLSWWLLTNRLRAGRTMGTGADWYALALPLLLWMAAGMVAFQMLSGVGVGVMLMGGWLTTGLALLNAVETESAVTTTTGEQVKERLSEPSYTNVDAAQGLLRLACFGALLLLYRMCEVRYDYDIRNVLLPDHYALLGLIVGVAVPGALSAFINALSAEEGDARDGAGASGLVLLPRLIAAGAFALGAPALLLLLFGTKCLLCLFFGLMIAPLIPNAARTTSLHNSRDAAPTYSTSIQPAGTTAVGFAPASVELFAVLFALAVGLAVAQWTHHVLPVSLMARADKVRLLRDGAGLAALLLLIAYVGARLRRFHARPSSSVDVTTKGSA